MSERRRHLLYEEMKEILSVESADEFMAAMPPVGWADVATKADLTLVRHEIATQGAELRGEIADLRGSMDGRLDAMDSRFDAMASRFDGRFDAMESRFDGRFDAVDTQFDSMESRFDGRFDGLVGQLHGMRFELLAEIANTRDSMRVWTIATMITVLLGMAGIILSVTQLHR